MTGREPAGGGAPPPRRAVLIGVVLAALLAVAAVLLGARLLAGAVAGGAPSAPVPGIAVEVDVPVGASARTIGDLLEAAGVVDARRFEREAARRGVASQLRAGRYALETGMDVDAVLDRLLAGPVEHSSLRVTVREGLAVDRVLDAIAEQTGLARADLVAALESGAVTSPYLPEELPDGVPPLARWEGLLFPATYEVGADDTAVSLLQRMADEMVTRMAAQDWSRLPNLGVDRYGALVVASLVEREAVLDEDRPLIASVVYNRLAAGMPLQIDATVVYALGTNPGRVTADDLEVDSPYNTYRITALPPTPIGTVGEASLEAATHPAGTEYLYFVVVSRDGRHGFSTTYAEHRRKVEQAKADGVLP